MLDYKKPIPDVTFMSNKLPVANPSQEELVYMDDEFVCDSMYNHWVEDEGRPLPGSSPSIMVRKTVCEMLHKAEALLPEGYKFKIYDAYRPIAVQQALWDYFREVKKGENPGATEEEIDKATLFCISRPSYNILLPALHNTGGAVDLTIIDKDGKELDMGCKFDEFTPAAWTAYFEKNGENEVARDNRRMLYNVMMEAGFSNFPSEWWHYDFGTEKWGLNTVNMPVYGGILDAQVKNTVPYEHMDEIRDIDAKQQEIARQINALRENCEKLADEAAEITKKA